jgi:hypothetical protein
MKTKVKMTSYKISDADARAIQVILHTCGGGPPEGPRGASDRLLAKIDRAIGAIPTWVDFEDGSIIRNHQGSIEFQDDDMESFLKRFER